MLQKEDLFYRKRHLGEYMHEYIREFHSKGCHS